jgi:hypothetical protein
MNRPVILVRDLETALAAAEAAADAGVPVMLLSQKECALTAGVGWFDAVMRAARRHAPKADAVGILDCGSRADLVQAAFRQGIDGAVYRGSPKIAVKLGSIADQAGRILLLRRPRAFDPGTATDPASMAGWLARQLK